MTMATKFKTPFNHNTDDESLASALTCKDASLTQQQFKDETDINVILERFTRGQDLPPVPLPEHFMDVSGKKSYFEMRSMVANAEATFYMLEADIRGQYLNNPERWADAVMTAINKGDRAKLREMGLDVPDAAPAAPQAAPTAPGTPTGTPQTPAS